MNVIVEFTVDALEFTLGQVLTESPDRHVELERLVPTGGSVIPFVWVRGGDFQAFEREVRESGKVADITVLDQVEDHCLYRIDWIDEPHSLLEGINQMEGAILEAHGNGTWSFRLRFPNHDALSQFYNLCTEEGITVHIERSYTLTERTPIGHQLGLSQEQREALVLGLRRGYFDTPSQVSLDELATELGISQQAMSNRIRRGTKQVLHEVLLSSAVDDD